MEFLTGITIQDLGPAALCTLCVLLIFFGRLVPRSAVEDIKDDRDTRLADLRQEATDWKNAYLAAETSRQVLSDQVAHLLELSKTTDHFIRSLPRPNVAGEDSE